MKAARYLRRTVASLALLLAAAALLLGTAVVEPQWFLTSRTVGWAIREFGSAYRPGWTGLDFSIHSPEILEKEVEISASGFCFAKSDGSLSGCFKRVAASFAFALDRTGVRLTELSLLDVQGESFRSDATKSAPAAAAKKGFDPFELPRLVPAAASGLSIGKARVDLPAFELADSSGTTKGALRLGFDPGRAEPLSLDARWTRRGLKRGAVSRGRALLSVASDLFRKGRLTYVDARGSYEGDGVSAEFSAKARQAGPEAVSLEARASGRAAGAAFRLDGRGVQTPTRYALKGVFGIVPSSGPLTSLRLEPFTLAAERPEGTALPEHLRLDARIRAEPAALAPVHGFTPPRFVTAQATLDFRAAPTALQKDRFEASLSILLNPYTSWFEAHADFFARASGRLSELPRLRIQQRVDAYATVPRFEDLVAFLEGGPYAVPAPVAAMKGALRAAFTARGAPGSDRAEFQYSARGDLSGERQKLRFHLAGDGAADRLTQEDRVVKVRAALTFDDVALQLPHLDALKMPAVTLDSRIKNAGAVEPGADVPASTASVAGSTSSVAIDLSVTTARPIVLYSDLAKTPVPIGLDLAFEKPPGQAKGEIAIKAFDVEFFRRKATVDHLTLTLVPGSKSTALDGLVKYKAAEASITIRLLGTAEKPQVVFESDPPLSQNDIIAMLVFGKSPDELDADQTATVANAQTAMSDKAFGLASLYLFASTPIQFVGYDPAAKAYTMKLLIPGGETLALSSDFDATKTVQLRKRLSRHFAIATEAVSSQTQGNGVVTFLEWFTRY